MIIFILFPILLFTVIECFSFAQAGFLITSMMSIFFPYINETFFLDLKTIEGVGNNIVYALFLLLFICWAMISSVLLASKPKSQKQNNVFENSSLTLGSTMIYLRIPKDLNVNMDPFQVQYVNE